MTHKAYVIRQDKVEPKEVKAKEGGTRKALLYTASIKMENGEFKLARWGTSLAEFVGSNVEFEAKKYDDKYKTFTVGKDIRAVDSANKEPEHSEVLNATHTVSSATNLEQDTDFISGNLDGITPQAVEIVVSDLKTAKEIAQDVLGTQDANAIVAIATAIKEVRTTMFIEQNKRGRVADMARNRR